MAKKIPGRTGQQCAQRWRHKVPCCLLCPANLVAQAIFALRAALTACSGSRHAQNASAIAYVTLSVSETVTLQVNPNIRKEKWSEDEDRRLLKLVKQYGNAWAEISRCLDGRTDQQCMGRWRRHLDPSIRRDSWAPQEDQALHELYQQYGSQWSQISLGIPGRTAQQCRARSRPYRPCTLHSRACRAWPPL